MVDFGDLVGGAFELLVEVWDWWPEGKAEKRDEPPVPTVAYHERPSCGRLSHQQ